MITFHKVSFKNFLSTGDQPNVIFLDRTPSALITGTNGAGKSTMLDALCFGIFGKPYRNINKPQLVNTVNEKNAEVEVEFSVNEVRYKVVRGIRPNKFEVWQNDNLMQHDAAIKDYQKKLEEILGLNYKAFTQIVILGSARYQSFMDLGNHDRRIIIEEILDITVFSKMNQVLKTRIQNNEIDAKDNDYQKEIIKTKINAQKGLIQNILNRSKESDEKIDAEKKRIQSEKTLLEKRIEEIDSDANKIVVTDLNSLNDKLAAAKFKAKEVATKGIEIDNKISFFEENDECLACGQSIDEKTKVGQIETLDQEKQKLRVLAPVISDTLSSLDSQIVEAESINDAYQSLQLKKADCQNEIRSLDRVLKSLEGQKDETSEEDLEEQKKILAELEDDFRRKEKDGYELAEVRHHLDVCKILLKDEGIKAKIIKQYLPIINKLINQYLDRMGANYSFNLDEQFNEVIKSRYRDQFSYASFSEGEKMRIDLALMFTWREIAKLKNSINTNLLIMDEVGDSSLDAEATDVLWEILSDLENTNVFVISHKATNGDKFRSLIEIFKDGNFSKIRDSKV